MRSMKLVALGALSLLSLVGCNQGQPRIYRVAVDATPVRTIAVPSCFRNNNLPAGRGNITEQNYRSEDEWVIWNGIDQTEYLDLGTQTFEPRRRAHHPRQRTSSKAPTRPSRRCATSRSRSPTSTPRRARRRSRVKFNDYSFSPTGTIALNAQYACIKGRADCPVGRRLAPGRRELQLVAQLRRPQDRRVADRPSTTTTRNSPGRVDGVQRESWKQGSRFLCAEEARMVVKGQYLERPTLIPLANGLVLEGVSHRGENCGPACWCCPRRPSKAAAWITWWAPSWPGRSRTWATPPFRFNYRGVGGSQGQPSRSPADWLEDADRRAAARAGQHRGASRRWWPPSARPTRSRSRLAERPADRRPHA